MASMVINGVKIGTSHRFLLQKLSYLSKERGYCYAMNEYLGKFLNLSKSRISHLLSDLRKAKMIDVLLIYDTEHKLQVIGRRIAVLSDARGIAENSKVQNEKSIKDNIETDETVDNSAVKSAKPLNPLTEVCKNGAMVGIPVNVTLKSAERYGITRVREALSICAVSKSVRSMVAYFLGALKKGYRPNRQAKKVVGKTVKRSVFKTPMKPDLSNEYANTRKVTTADNEFLKEFAEKHSKLAGRLIK